MYPPCDHQFVDSTAEMSESVDPRLTQDPEPIRVRQSPESILLRLFATLDTNPDDASAMRQILEAITSIIPCTQAFFYEWTAPSGQFKVTREASTDTSLLKHYLTSARATDPCAQDKARQQCIHTARSQSLSDLLAVETRMDSPFVKGFMGRNEDLRDALYHHADVSNGHFTSLHLFRSAGEAAFSRSESKCLDHLHAHVVLWLRQRWASTALRQERDALQMALDVQATPVFLLDSHAKVLACNHAADLQLREGRRLSLADNTLLSGSQMDHASWIPEAIKRLMNPAANSESSQIHLEPLPCTQARQARHYGVLARVPHNNNANTKANTATAMLTLIDTRPPVARHEPSELRRVFGFTGAEARVADALVAGMGTDDIAEAFGIRRDTVRSHIKRLLAKTGTRGNAELQKLLLRIAPNLLPLQRKNPHA